MVKKNFTRSFVFSLVLPNFTFFIQRLNLRQRLCFKPLYVSQPVKINFCSFARKKNHLLMEVVFNNIFLIELNVLA